MHSAPPRPVAPSSPKASRAVLRDLAVASAVAAGATAATWRVLDLTASHLVSALVLQCLLVGLVLWALPEEVESGRHGIHGVGPANRITLGRGALAVPIAALALAPAPSGPGARWWVIALASVVMILDGVDGRLARRTGSQSDFGARFDMELDAALILALSVLVWRAGLLGAWVLLIGLMRYLFVAGGSIWPSLRSDLPPSLRRKVVCVMQGIVLLVALGPPVPRPLAASTAAAGLFALGYSFLVDVRWALTHGRPR